MSKLQCSVLLSFSLGEAINYVLRAWWRDSVRGSEGTSDKLERRREVECDAREPRMSRPRVVPESRHIQAIYIAGAVHLFHVRFSRPTLTIYSIR